MMPKLFLVFSLLTVVSFACTLGLDWIERRVQGNSGGICDVNIMNPEGLCLMQHSPEGQENMTVEALLRTRLKRPNSNKEWVLKGFEPGLLPDLFNSYKRSVGNPFSRTTFQISWAADAFLCTSLECDVVMDLRWLSTEGERAAEEKGSGKRETLAALIHVLPDGILGFGLNYRQKFYLNISEAQEQPYGSFLEETDSIRDSRPTGGKRKIIYKDTAELKKLKTTHNSTSFDLYSLRNTAKLERTSDQNTPYVGRAIFNGVCHLVVFPNMDWYARHVRIDKNNRCSSPSQVSFIYAPAAGGGAVFCNKKCQKTVNSRAICRNSSWLTVKIALERNGLVPQVIETARWTISGLDFHVITTAGIEERQALQSTKWSPFTSTKWSAFSSALRGIVEEANANRPSPCIVTDPIFLHGEITTVRCSDLEAKVDAMSTVELREKGKILQDFLPSAYLELPSDKDREMVVSGFEHLKTKSVHSVLFEVEKDMERKVREMSDQFSTRITDTATVFGSVMTFVIALLGVLVAWPGIKEAVERYWETYHLRLPLQLLYFLVTLALIAGLLFPILVDEAVTRQNLHDVDLQMLQSSAQAGGFGDYRVVLLTNVKLEPLREVRVWIFYSLTIAMCAFLLILAMIEGKHAKKLHAARSVARETPEIPSAKNAWASLIKKVRNVESQKRNIWKGTHPSTISYIS